MSLRKLVAIVVLTFAAFVVVTTIAFYALWSGGEDPPRTVTTLRQ
jgi:hypothetical protein